MKADTPWINTTGCGNQIAEGEELYAWSPLGARFEAIVLCPTCEAERKRGEPTGTPLHGTKGKARWPLTCGTDPQA